MRNKIRKFIFFTFLNLLPFLVFAQTNLRVTNPILATSFQEMVTRIGNWIFTLGIGILPIMILIGAYVLVTGGGNPEKRSLGMKIILYAIIGFVIIALTKGIIALIRTILRI